MDWGLASNMRADVAEPQLQIDSATEGTQGTDIDDSHISLLECEIEALSLNLEEEKKNTSRVRAECAKHLEELEDAERELLRCQTALKESGGKLAHAQVEMRDKNEDVIDAEEELMQCRVRVGELKQHIEDMAGQNQEKARSHQVQVDELISKLEKAEDQHAQHDSMVQQQASALNEMNELHRETLEEQSRLTIQIKTLEDEAKPLRRALQIAQNEAANKAEEMDVLRNYIRGSGQRKPKKEGDALDTETEMEKNLRMKDSMISRYTHQIEEFRVKTRRIPELASQLSKAESRNATLTSQRAALAADVKSNAKAFEQKESEMRDSISKLESALLSSEAKTEAIQSAYKKEICDVKASRNALEQGKKKTTERIARLESEKAKLERDVSQSKDAQKALDKEKKTLEQRISCLEKLRTERRSLLGIVFCVDLSGSLCGNPGRLAKEAFRKLVNELHAKSPNAHVGVVLHTSSTFVARQMAEVDLHTSSMLDSITCSGTENYRQAFIHIVSQLSAFKASYPGANRRVIMISDGEGCGVPGDVSTLRTDGVPCHNLVISKGSLVSAASSSTRKYSSMTGGRNFMYDGSLGLSDVEVLIA